MTANTRLLVTRILALIAVIAVTIFIFSIRDKADQLAAYGYPGIFLIAFLAYATVLLPAPGIAIIFAMGSVFNPLWVGVVAGAGGALGEFSGYMAGFSGQAVIERAKIYDRMVQWVEKYGILAVICLSAIPNPFFDLTGIAAGALKMQPGKFLFAVWIGVTVKMLIFSWAGSSTLPWLLE